MLVALVEVGVQIGKHAPAGQTVEAALGVGLFAVVFIAALGAAMCVYFLPAIVGRHKRNANAIFVLNLLAGWTFVGWVVAMVWACTVDQPGT